MQLATAMQQQSALQSSIQPFIVPQISILEPCSPATKLQLSSVSPPASSCSTGTAAPLGSSTVSPSSSVEVTCQNSQQWMHGNMKLLTSTPARASEVTGTQAPATVLSLSREWLYRLVTFPSYFTPCVNCCSGSRTPKREQLMTQFDTQHPYRVYCSHCPECKSRSSTLLQVRRSAFKDVVKATDIQGFGADVAGVQQYTLNGSKVIYLNREQTPDKKSSNASTAPAQCSVDGRAMMDKSSQYCSLKCKMHAEDPGFNAWLDQQDPSVRILAQAAANAPPRPTAASKRAHSSSSSDGSAHTAKTKKLTHTSSSGNTAGTAAGTPTGLGSSGESAAPLSSAAPSAFQQQVARGPTQRAAPAVLHGGLALAAAGHGGMLLDGAAGLRPVITGMSGARQHAAPSAFLEAAMSDPLLVPSTAAGSQPTSGTHPECGGGVTAMEFDAVSFASWDSELSSPLLVDMENLESLSWADDGGFSDTLKAEASADWWLSGGTAAAGAAVQQEEGADDGQEGELLIPGLECFSGAALIC